MNLTQQEKYTLIGSAGGFVLSRVFDTGVLGTLIIVGLGAYAGYNYDTLKGYVSNKSKNSLAYLSEGDKATEDDAKNMIQLINDKKSLNYSDFQQKRFVGEYVKSISKKENDYLIKLLDKDESKFTEGEKKLYSKLVDILKEIVIQRD